MIQVKVMVKKILEIQKILAQSQIYAKTGSIILETRFYATYYHSIQHFP